MFCLGHVLLAKKCIFSLWFHLWHIITPLCAIPSQIPSNRLSMVETRFLRTYFFFPFYFSRKTMRTWKLHSTTWLKSFTIFTRRKLNRWRHWHRTFIFVVFSPWWEGRSIFSLHNFYLFRKAFLKIEVSTFLQLKGLILGFSFLRIFQPNLLKLVYLLLLFSHVKYWQVLVYV